MNTYPLDQYERELLAADWTYEYSEGAVYYRGLEEMTRLTHLSRLSPEHRALFDKIADERIPKAR